jgi:hypothetical protein
MIKMPTLRFSWPTNPKMRIHGKHIAKDLPKTRTHRLNVGTYFQGKKYLFSIVIFVA